MLVLKSTWPDRTTEAHLQRVADGRSSQHPPDLYDAEILAEKKNSAVLLDGLYIRAADKIGPTTREDRKKLQSGIGPSFRDMVNIYGGHRYFDESEQIAPFVFHSPVPTASVSGKRLTGHLGLRASKIESAIVEGSSSERNLNSLG